MRSRLVVALLAAAFWLAGAVLAPAAFAAGSGGAPHSAAGRSGHQPVELANTGLDITAPVILGLAALAVGVALVCWAFLHTRQVRHR